MAETKFKEPIKNRKSLYYRPKGKPPTKRRKTSTKIPIYVPKQRYVALFHKAKSECPTASPVHDILELLLEYYIEGEFVLSRKLIPVEDETVVEDVRKKRRNTYDMAVKGEEEVRLWMILTKYENDRFTRKANREGLTKSYAMNLLIDFYLKNKFIVRTAIIRVNRYRTGNQKKDVKLFENRKREKRYIEDHHDNFV
jgi:hypothetical protein